MTKTQQDQAWRMWIAGRALGLRKREGMSAVEASKQAMWEAQQYRAEDEAAEAA